MAIGPLETFVFPGVYTKTVFEPGTATSQRTSGDRYPAIIGLVPSEMSGEFSIVRGAAVSDKLLRVVDEEKLKAFTSVEVNFDGAVATVKTSFAPIKGANSFVKVNGVAVDSEVTDAGRGIITLGLAPRSGDVVSVSYDAVSEDKYSSATIAKAAVTFSAGVAKFFIKQASLVIDENDESLLAGSYFVDKIADGTHKSKYLVASSATGVAFPLVSYTNGVGATVSRPVFKVTQGSSTLTVTAVSGNTGYVEVLTANTLDDLVVEYFSPVADESFDVVPVAGLNSITSVGKYISTSDYVTSGNKIHWESTVINDTFEQFSAEFQDKYETWTITTDASGNFTQTIPAGFVLVDGYNRSTTLLQRIIKDQSPLSVLGTNLTVTTATGAHIDYTRVSVYNDRVSIAGGPASTSLTIGGFVAATSTLKTYTELKVIVLGGVSSYFVDGVPASVVTDGSGSWLAGFKVQQHATPDNGTHIAKCYNLSATRQPDFGTTFSVGVKYNRPAELMLKTLCYNLDEVKAYAPVGSKLYELARVSLASGAPKVALKAIVADNMSNYTAALVDFEDPMMEDNSRPSNYALGTTDVASNSFLHGWCLEQSKIRYRNPSVMVAGVSKASTSSDAKAFAKSIFSRFGTLVWPNTVKVSGITAEQGGEFLAAAWLGLTTNRAYDLGTTMTGRTLNPTVAAGSSNLKLRDQESLAEAGVTVFQRTGSAGALECLLALTTDPTDELTREPRITELSHKVEKDVQILLDQYRGLKKLRTLPRTIQGTVATYFSNLRTATVITDFKAPVVKESELDPSTYEVEVLYKPMFSVNWIIATFRVSSVL